MKIATNKENRTILLIILAMLAIVIGGTIVLKHTHETYYGTRIDLRLRDGISVVGAYTVWKIEKMEQLPNGIYRMNNQMFTEHIKPSEEILLGAARILNKCADTSKWTIEFKKEIIRQLKVNGDIK